MRIDGHCHVASMDFIPRSFIDGVVANMLAAARSTGLAIAPERMSELVMASMQDPDCDELAAEMTAAGIDRAVLLLPDFTYALRDCRLTIAEMFERHHRVLVRHPGRFVVFAGVDPRWGKDAIALFERGVRELGFRGLKLYPPCGYSPSDPSLGPFYELCAHHRIPVLLHTGATSPALSFETASPVLVDSAARAHPGVDFILAHASTWYVEEAIMMAASRPNVYVDVSGYAAAPVARVGALLERGIDHKIIFGTDWPVFRMQARQADLVAPLLADSGPLARLSPRARDLVMGQTIHGLLARTGGPAGCASEVLVA